MTDEEMARRLRNMALTPAERWEFRYRLDRISVWMLFILMAVTLWFAWSASNRVGDLQDRMHSIEMSLTRIEDASCRSSSAVRVIGMTAPPNSPSP